MLQETTAPAGPDERYSGFKALWAKVIIRAVFDWITYRDSPKLEKWQMANAAQAWLFEPSDLFNGFENVCKLLDISPVQIRDKARAMTKDNVFKIEHRERDGRVVEDVRLMVQGGDEEI